MCVCLQHRLASYEVNKKGPVTYKATIENILMRARYPKIVYNAKSLHGDIAELIVENFLMKGADIISRVVVSVAERLSSQEDQQNKNPDTSKVYQKIVELIRGHYLKRMPMSNELQNCAEEDDFSNTKDDEEAFLIPSGIIQGSY